MVKVEWHYENKQSTFVMEGEALVSSRLYQYIQQPLAKIVDEVVESLQEILNSCYFIIEFHGGKTDYTLLKQCLEVSNDNQQIQLQWVNTKKTTVTYGSNIQRLKNIVNSSVVEAWKTDAINKKITTFENLSATFYVVATMSAGKSTVLNAMLGESILPTDHLATTAKLMRIKQTSAEGYSATAYNDVAEPILQIKNVVKEDLEAWNHDENIDEIVIEGPILHHNDTEITVELVDTPGPNNSQDKRHRAKIEKFIQTAEHPILLYIMDATKIATDDDTAYMQMLVKWFEQAHLDIAERTYFILNKVDEFETSEDVSRTLETVFPFLASYNIHNPKVYAISAQYALWYRQQQQGQALTSRQQRSLAIMDDVLQDLQLLQHATLSSRMKEQWQAKLEILPESQVLLARTGLPILEETLIQFVQNEAFIQQATEIVEELRPIAEEELRILTEHYKAEKEKQTKIFYQTEKMYELQTTEAVTKCYETIQTSIKQIIETIEQKWKLPEELMQEMEGVSSEIDNETVQTLNEAIGELLYNEKQYEYLKTHAIDLLNQIKEILHNLVQLQSPVQEEIKIQYELVNTMYETVKEGEGLIASKVRDLSGDEIKRPVYIKSILDLYFTSIQKWLQKQIVYWHDTSIDNVGIDSYYNQHFEEHFTMALELKHEQFEYDYQALLKQEKQELESYNQTINDLAFWYNNLKEGEVV